MNILLTTKQTAMLEELFDLVDLNYELGSPGMLVGQFFRSEDGEGYFKANYMSNEQSEIMLKALGFPVVIASSVVEVHMDVE